MLKCKWEIDNRTFHSEKELDQYLLDKYNENIGTTDGVKFSKETQELLFNINKEASEKLKEDRLEQYKRSIIESKLHPFEDIYEKYEDSKYKSVLNFIEEQKFVQGFNLTDFRTKRRAELKVKYPAEMNEDEKNNLANKEVNEEIESWDYIRKTGKGLHFIVEKILKSNFKKDLNPELYKDEILRLIKEEKRDDLSIEGISNELLEKFIKKVYSLKYEIFRNDPKAKIFSEFTIDNEITPETILRGKIDFLISHEDGTVDVIDLKVSTRHPNNYDDDRMNTLEHQLGFYRRMLNAKGIPNSKINLSILPVIINKPINNTIESLVFEKKVNIVPRVTASYDVNKTIEIKEDFVENKLVEKSVDSLAKMFGITTFNRGYVLNSVDDLFKSKVYKTPNNKFTFKDTLAREVKEFNTEEETKEYLKFYLEQTAQATIDLTLNLTNSLRQKLDQLNGKNIRDSEKRESDIKKIYNSTFNQFSDIVPQNLKSIEDYIESIFIKYRRELGWSVEANSELAQLGVIMLVNNTTKEVDIVSLTNSNIKSNIKLNGQTNILGKFYNDKQMETSENQMFGTIGNIELIKALTILNQMPKFSENNYKIGELRVFHLDNKNSTGSEVLDSDKLVYNYNNLAVKIGLEKNRLKFKDYYTKVFDAVSFIHDNLNVNSDLSKIMEARTGNAKLGMKAPSITMSAEEKLEEIRSLHKVIWNKWFKDAKMEKLKDNSIESFLYIELSKALASLTDTVLDPFNTAEMQRYTGTWSNRSLLNGTNSNTTDTNPIIKNLNRLLNSTNNKITKKYTDYKNTTRVWFSDELNKWGGFGSNALVRNYTPAFERFIDRSTEEIKKDFRLKDPKTDTTLNPDEKAFLEKYLKILNSHRFAGYSEEELDLKKITGEYFRIPLLRSKSGYRVLRAGSVKNAANIMMENTVMDILNPANETKEQMELTDRQLEGNSPYEMYNTISQSDNDLTRSNIIAGNDPFTTFEINLEEVLDTYVNSKIKEQEYNEMLPVFNSAIVTLKVSTFLFNNAADATVNFLNDYINSSIMSRSLLDKEFQGVHKFLSGLKQVSSKAILGGNYRSGIKEVMVSWITLANRSFANSLFDKDKPGIKDLQYAYRRVWSDSIKQVKTEDTLFEALNYSYRMANMDMSEQVGRQNKERSSWFNLDSRLYWFNRAPDFLNRMTILIAYMQKHGCLDAHTVSKTGELKYDWRKDKRFDLLSSGKTNYEGEELRTYQFQKALYNAMMEEFVNENYQIEIKNDDGTFNYKVVTYDDDLPRAFTTKEAAAIKQEADSLFGYMDNDTKSMYLKNTIFIYLHQFQTYLSAKKNQWFLKRDIYSDGSMKQQRDLDTGKLLYKQFDPETGELIGLTTEVTDTPHIIWTGKITEGILWSLVDLLNVTDINNLKAAWKDPVKLRNIIIASQDLAWLLLMMWLASFLFDEKSQDASERIAHKIFNNVSSDLNIYQSLTGAVDFKFPAFDFIKNIKDDIIKVFSGDLDLLKIPERQIGVLRGLSLTD